MLENLKKFKERNKILLLRVDYNVDFDKKGRILDDFRIRQTLPTIKYLLNLNSKIILSTHLGRPKFPISDLSTLRLKPHLEYLFKRKIFFLKNFEVKKEEIEKEKPKSIFLLENLRFNKGEEKNDISFAKKLSSLADFFVFEAFSVSHRKHCSVVSLPKFLKSYYGFLFEKEIKNLKKVLLFSEKPLSLILGGAKEETKFPLIKNWLKKADFIILGGVMANDFLKAEGFQVGTSLYSPNFVSKAKEILNSKEKEKIILPKDVILLSHQRRKRSSLLNIGLKDSIYDIGKETIDFYKNFILKSKTIIFNGPMGYIEDKRFREGTSKIVDFILSSKAFSVVGGGETLMFLKEKKVREKFSFVSTGGGAMLEFLSGKKLPIFDFINLNEF